MEHPPGTPWSISLMFLNQICLQIDGKRSWCFLCQLLQVPLLNAYEKSTENAHGTPWVNSTTLLHEILITGQWKMLLRLPLSIPTSSSINSFLEVNGKWSCVSSSIGSSQWEMFLEFPGHVLSNFLVNLYSKSMEIILEILVLTPLHFAIDSRFKINGKCSWSFLGQFLQVALSHPYSKSVIIIKRKCNGRCL